MAVIVTQSLPIPDVHSKQLLDTLAGGSVSLAVRNRKNSTRGLVV